MGLRRIDYGAESVTARCPCGWADTVATAAGAEANLAAHERSAHRGDRSVLAASRRRRQRHGSC